MHPTKNVKDNNFLSQHCIFKSSLNFFLFKVFQYKKILFFIAQSKSHNQCIYQKKIIIYKTIWIFLNFFFTFFLFFFTLQKWKNEKSYKITEHFYPFYVEKNSKVLSFFSTTNLNNITFSQNKFYNLFFVKFFFNKNVLFISNNYILNTLSLHSKFKRM